MQIPALQYLFFSPHEKADQLAHLVIPTSSISIYLFLGSTFYNHVPMGRGPKIK